MPLSRTGPRGEDLTRERYRYEDWLLPNGFGTATLWDVLAGLRNGPPLENLRDSDDDYELFLQQDAKGEFERPPAVQLDFLEKMSDAALAERQKKLAKLPSEENLAKVRRHAANWQEGRRQARERHLRRSLGQDEPRPAKIPPPPPPAPPPAPAGALVIDDELVRLTTCRFFPPAPHDDRGITLALLQFTGKVCSLFPQLTAEQCFQDKAPCDLAGNLFVEPKHPREDEPAIFTQSDWRASDPRWSEPFLGPSLVLGLAVQFEREVPTSYVPPPNVQLHPADPLWSTVQGAKVVRVVPAWRPAPWYLNVLENTWAYAKAQRKLEGTRNPKKLAERLERLEQETRR